MTANELVAMSTPDSFPLLNRRKEIYIIPTSYVRGTPQMSEYVSLLEKGHPRPAYELVQNMLDYQNWDKGTPEIWIYTTEGERISYPEFIGSSIMEIARICNHTKKISFVNDIIPGGGMTPENVLHTKHGGGLGTLGEHGIGGRATGTSLVAGGHASSIEYTSCDTDGSWKGQAVMANTFPGQKDPAYTLGFQRTNESVDKTEVTVHNPSAAFTNSLSVLGDIFLPASIQYEQYKLNHTEPSKDSTQFSMYFREGIRTNNGTKTDINLAKRMGVAESQRYTEEPRIEILDPSITHVVEPTGGLNNHVFVDGLLVGTDYDQYALRWAFWGLNNGERGYNAKRSNNSALMQGNPKDAMAVVLGSCTNADVFTDILYASEKGVYGQGCVEGSVSKELFLEALHKNPDAIVALRKGWLTYCAENGVDPVKTCVTPDRDAYQKAEKMGVHAVHLFAPSIISALEELHIAQRLEKVVHIPDDPKETGEVMIIEMNEEYWKADLQKLAYNLIVGARYMGWNEEPARVAIDVEKGICTLSSNRTQSLKSLMRFGRIDSLWEAFGEDVGIEVIMPGTPDIKYFFEPKVEYWRTDKCKVSIKQQPLPETEKKITETQITIISRSNSAEFRDFLTQTTKLFKELTTDGIHIDRDLFDKRHIKNDVKGENKLYALDDAIRAKERELGEMERSLKEQKTKELNKLDEMLDDKKRQLGLIIEDREEKAPTRKRRTPPLRTDWRPPPELRKTYSTLYHPDDTPTTSNRRGGLFEVEEENPIQTTEEARAFIERHFDAMEHPDIGILRPQDIPWQVRGTLVTHRNRVFSSPPQFVPIEVPKTRTISKPGIVMGTGLVEGTHSIPLFPQSKIIGVYHPDAQVLESLRIEYAENHGTYTVSSAQPIPAGLQVYVKCHESNTTKEPPSEFERADLADINSFSPAWQDLIFAVKTATPPLTSEEKRDIALTAWLHAFKYDKDARVDDLFKGLPPRERYAELVNKATGNCGYCGEGFVVLSRAFGLASVELSGYLGHNGRFFPGPNNHALAGVYSEERKEWVVVEPQARYLSTRHKRNKIDNDYLAIIQGIPTGHNIFPLLEQEGIRIGDAAIAAQTEELRRIMLDGATISMLQRIAEIEMEEENMFWGNDSDLYDIPGRRDAGGSKPVSIESILVEAFGITQNAHSKKGIGKKIIRQAASSLAVGVSIGLAGAFGLTKLAPAMVEALPQIGEGVRLAEEVARQYLPQGIDSGKVTVDLAKIIITAVLTGGGVHIREAVKYGALVKSLKEKIKSYEKQIQADRQD